MDAVLTETDAISSKFYRADELGLCPECGEVMNETDRLKEGRYIFIWLKCIKSDCDGQWLQKKPNNHVVGV